VGKAAGVWRWPTTQYSAEVKERLELYHILHLWGLRGLLYGDLYLLPLPH